MGVWRYGDFENRGVMEFVGDLETTTGTGQPFDHLVHCRRHEKQVCQYANITVGDRRGRSWSCKVRSPSRFSGRAQGTAELSFARQRDLRISAPRDRRIASNGEPSRASSIAKGSIDLYICREGGWVRLTSPKLWHDSLRPMMPVTGWQPAEYLGPIRSASKQSLAQSGNSSKTMMTALPNQRRMARGTIVMHSAHGHCSPRSPRSRIRARNEWIWMRC
jgi:hypothetical protein